MCRGSTDVLADSDIGGTGSIQSAWSDAARARREPTRQAPPSGSAREAWHGFTLTEVVLALSVLGIVLAALGSVLTLSLRALPNRGDATEQPLIVARVLEQMSDDIQSAKKIASTSSALTLTIPDRDANGSDEVIEYAWGATRGAALRRRVNGGSWTTVIASLSSAAFNVERFASRIDGTGTLVDSSEQILSAWETGATASYSLSTSVWAAQTVLPVLPADAVAWKPTKIEVNVRNVTPIDGVVVVDLRTPNSDGTPSATSLFTASINESSMTSSYAWYTVSLSGMSSLSPSSGISVVFRTNGSGVVAGRMQGLTSGVASPGLLATSANGGGLWTTFSDGAIYHRLWGVVTRPTTTSTAVDRVRSVTIALTPTNSRAFSTRVYTTGNPEAL
ncbi:MAG: type II secretion system protein [Planctomycetota bacterium]|nr:type II secretion system protein [Planctomycetota bacterium]